MRILTMFTSPRRERSASIAIVDSFLFEYKKKIKGLVVDTLDVLTESLPEFGAEAIGAKYKGVSGEAMTPSERATWEKIRELASRFEKADRIVLGIPMWNFSFPYKLKQLIDLACQRNMLFIFDGKEYGPALNIDKAFVAYVRGQSEEAGFQTVPPPGFEYVTKYIEFWLHFIGVHSITAMTVVSAGLNDGAQQGAISKGAQRGPVCCSLWNRGSVPGGGDALALAIRLCLPG